MDKKSKILIIVIIVLIVGSVAATYWRIMIKKDYMISAQTDCDPTIDRCFVWNCDPASNEEGVACTGDPETDIWYYQVINRKAANIPLCDPKDENCDALTCPEGEKDCSVEFCDEATNKTEDSCSDPETYIQEHPEALEEENCDPGTDENCTTDETCDSETGENCVITEECDPATDENCTPDTSQCDPATDENCSVEQPANSTDSSTSLE